MSRKSKKKSDSHDYAAHLKDESDVEIRNKKRSRWEKFRTNFNDFREHIHTRGRERLTVMVIPHTEKKILTLHVSLYTIAATCIIIFIILIVSVFNLIGKSGKEIQFYDMGLSNSQFNLQSIKMAEEMIPLHELITDYSNTIADMYLKLDGKQELVEGQGGVAQNISVSEVNELRDLVKQCREQGDDCGQQLTENILQRVIHLSEQDNFNLTRSVKISDQILAELKTPEKKNLLLNTPSIWPVNGFLLQPYGMQNDAFEGREKFSRGISIGALPGTEIFATAPGKITEIKYDSERGLQVRIQHKYGIQTYYAHLDRLRAKKGDTVNKGQVIGFVGQSGLTTGYKLYYEVHVGTVAYNPHAFLNHMRDLWLTQPRN